MPPGMFAQGMDPSGSNAALRPRDHYNEVPGLAPTNSGSSSSNPSTPGDEERRGKRRNHRSLNLNSSSDGSILRGAEILRQQIMQKSFDQEEAQNYLRKQPSGDHSNPDGLNSPCETYPLTRDSRQPVTDPEDGDDSSEATDWSDPWPPPANVDSSYESHGREPSGGIEPAEEQKEFAFTADADAKHWAHLSDTDQDEEDTVAILERAGEIIGRAREAMQLPTERVSPEVIPDESIEKEEAHEGAHHSRTDPFLVNRVDDSTFDSSYLDAAPLPQFGNGSYLPSALLPAADAVETRPHPPTRPEVPAQWVNSEFNQPQCNPLDLLKQLQADEEELLPMSSRMSEEEEERVHEERSAMLQKEVRKDPNVALMALPVLNGPSPFDNVVSPCSTQYTKLLRDPGFCHAKKAGTLWQSLVSQHVRFPSKWWNGARSPPMGVAVRRLWSYVGRHRVRGNPFLEQSIRNRGSAGKLLMHLIVRDIMTLQPVLDIAVGCLHPNARGVRTTSAFDPQLESCRDIWLALRQREDEVSVIESLLKHKQVEVDASPLGGKHDVNNNNMRAVFGESPPTRTVFVQESDLYELFSKRLDGSVPPAAVLLERYLPEW